MRKFIINALLGAAAVQGVSTGSMSQRFSSSRNRNKAGEGITLRCPWVDARSADVHTPSVHVSGFQPARTDNDTEGLVSWWFSLEGLAYPNNTLRAFLYEATNRKDVRNAVRKCIVPDPTPPFIQFINNYVTTDGSSDAAWQRDIGGDTFSMWANNDKIAGVGSTRSKYIWHIQAIDNDTGEFVDIGCCALEPESPLSMVNDYDDHFGPLGQPSVPELYNLFSEKQKEKWCMLQKGPEPPQVDVNIPDVLRTITSKVGIGSVPITNSVIAGLSPTETVVPKLQSIAPVLTTTGFCAGLDLIYDENIDEDSYQPGLGSVVGAATPLLDNTIIKNVKKFYSSPDQLDNSVLAFKWEVYRDETLITVVTCGRFQEEEDKQKNMICHDFGTLQGFDGMTRSDGAITEATVYSILVYGGVSTPQMLAWQASANWFESTIASQGIATGHTYAESIVTSWETLTLGEGSHPVIDSIQTFNRADNGACGQVIVTWKNTTPASITYTFTADTLAAGTTEAYTTVNDYLEYVEFSDDSSVAGVIALRFTGALSGSTLDCGNFDAGSATILEPTPAQSVDPTPVIFAWDQENGSIGGVTVHTVDYDTLDGDFKTWRTNTNE